MVSLLVIISKNLLQIQDDNKLDMCIKFSNANKHQVQN